MGGFFNSGSGNWKQSAEGTVSFEEEALKSGLYAGMSERSIRFMKEINFLRNHFNSNDYSRYEYFCKGEKPFGLGKGAEKQGGVVTSWFNCTDG